jgi:Domain of unknown function (DUF4440)
MDLSLNELNNNMEQKFLELETEWMNAWKNKDEKTARKLIADEFTLVSSVSTGNLIDKEEWLKNVLHNFDCKDLRIDKLQARIYNNTAVLNIWLHQEAVVNGQDWNGDFLLTDVWIQKNENWQVVARHASWLQKK